MEPDVRFCSLCLTRAPLGDFLLYITERHRDMHECVFGHALTHTYKLQYALRTEQTRWYDNKWDWPEMVDAGLFMFA